MKKGFTKMVVVPTGKWSLVLTKGHGYLIKIGPFEEWVPQKVVDIDPDGTLYVSFSYLTPGRLWTAVLKNYPSVLRPIKETVAPGRDDENDDDMDIQVEIKRI